MIRRLQHVVIVGFVVGSFVAGGCDSDQSPPAIQFVDISPDELGPTAHCPEPCVAARTGGRVNGLAEVPGDPETYFAASEVGGLFKYDAEKKRWVHLDGHLPTRTWDVAATPGGKTVYATFFYDGRMANRAGLQVSTDGGVIWKGLSGPMSEPPSNCHPARAAQPSGFGIALRPESNEVLVGTNCGIARSVDGGNTWVRFDPIKEATPIPTTLRVDTPFGPVVPTPREVPTLNPGVGSVWDLVALPGGRTYACGDDGLLWSPDGAPTTWSVVPRVGASPLDPGRGKPDPATADPPATQLLGFCSLAVSPDEPNVVIAMFGFGVVFDLVGIDGGRFFEGEVQFDRAGKAKAVAWSTLPNPDGPSGTKRVPFVATNDRSFVVLPPSSQSLPGFDLWFGGGNLVRVPCVTGKKPRCSVDKNHWSPQPTLTYTDAKGGQAGPVAHGDSGDVVFDQTAKTDACPVLYSSDGGIYRQVETQIDKCHTQALFESANAGLHAFLIQGMAGVNREAYDEDLYMATQDNGLYATAKSGYPVPHLDWRHTDAGPDSFDVVADDKRVVVTDASLITGDPGLVSIKTVVPDHVYDRTTSLAGARESIAQAGPDRYMIASRGGGNPDLPPVPRGLLDSHAIDDAWYTPGAGYTGPQPLGGVPWPAQAQAPCHVQVSQGTVGPQPYVLAGDVTGTQTKAAGACDYATPNQLWTFVGGQWKQRQPPQGAGFNMVGVHPRNPQRLYAATLDLAPQDSAGVKCCGASRMFRSIDGGQTWQPDDELTELMHGRGTFRPTYQDPGDGVLPVPQPVMVAFDPHYEGIVVAGGRESGLFLSSDGGDSWAVLTDPHGTSSDVPHLPRPFFVHFEHRSDPGASPPDPPHLYVGSQGRGVWRVRLVQADLSVTMFAKPPSGGPPAGSELTYLGEVHNNGPGVALHVEMEDLVPTGTTFKSIDAPAGWSCLPPPGPGLPVRCQKPKMTKYEHAHFKMVVTVNPSTPSGAFLLNNARVVSAAVDPHMANNTDGDTTKVAGGGTSLGRFSAVVFPGRRPSPGTPAGCPGSGRRGRRAGFAGQEIF